MIRFKTIHHEELIVYFPNEYNVDQYTQVDISNTIDATIIYKIIEFDPKIKWRITKHENLRRVADYEILNGPKTALKMFLSDLFFDITEHLPEEVEQFSKNVTKLYYELQKYYKFDIINVNKYFNYIDNEYLELLKSTKTADFNYFFPIK